MSIFLAALAAVTSTASANTTDLRAQMGVNLSGCEFDAVGTLCPKLADVDSYIDLGFTVIRLPFRDAINPTRIYPIVDRILARGATVILDRHDFKWPLVDEQVAFWSKMAGPYASHRRVLIDIMNEPKSFNDPVETNDWMQWARDSNQIIAGLRKAKISNTIVLEWPGYSSAALFGKNEADTAPCKSAVCALDRSGGLVDPLRRTLLSPHYYYDQWGAGASGECALALTIDQARVAAKARGYRLLLGESAVGSFRGIPASCTATAAALKTEFRQYSATWAGVTWWGGGAAWRDEYFFKMQPSPKLKPTVPDTGYAVWAAAR